MTSYLSRGASALALAACFAGLASCGLPRSGPNKSEIFKGSVLKQGDAFIVSVNSRVTRATAVRPSFGFSQAFQNAGVLGSDTISSGDKLGLTIFENVKDDPLLGNTGQRVAQLTELEVDGQGNIFVPYAGKVKAAGQSPETLRTIITEKLDTQTPDPQVIVQRLAGDGATVTISGFAGAQGVLPIQRPTRTLLSMLAQAGGVSIDPETAIVRVTRGGQTGKIWLLDLYSNPELDIALRAGDQITVEQDTRNFTALGATGSQQLVDFESQNLSAIEAIATVGGLSTSAADPTGVFVFRNEPPEIANAVLGRGDLQGDQRFVYVLDLTQPTGMFEARDFLIRDGDTVYVTEAPFVQWTKVLSAITGTTSAASTLSTAAGTALGNAAN
ncbi:MAG: polysaccharide biosynthesis/export family protein [Cypionkella sp.]